MTAVLTIVWVVDDLPSNHDLVRRSLPAGWESVCELVSFDSGTSALEELALGLDVDPERLPDVVFMDFFLGDHYGNEVTKQLRTLFAAKGLAGPFVVGHSSALPASHEIVRAGGDVAIEKDKQARVSSGIQGLFPDAASRAAHQGRGRRAV